MVNEKVTTFKIGPEIEKLEIEILREGISREEALRDKPFIKELWERSFNDYNHYEILQLKKGPYRISFCLYRRPSFSQGVIIVFGDYGLGLYTGNNTNQSLLGWSYESLDVWQTLCVYVKEVTDVAVHKSILFQFFKKEEQKGI